jgi:putative effector of murein hydrolase LrgA (UPF0299 family)
MNGIVYDADITPEICVWLIFTASGNAVGMSVLFCKVGFDILEEEWLADSALVL